VRAHAETLGQRLRAARERLGLTQFALAVSIGVQGNQVSRWERDQDAPRVVHLIRLRRALRVSLDDLVPQEGGGENDSV
jgi:transcriptional regulator with XRE-family HTH domain